MKCAQTGTVGVSSSQHGSNEKVWFDWNRHAKPKPGKVKNSDQGMNVLYCDGHAATVSAREAYQAVRFK